MNIKKTLLPIILLLILAYLFFWPLPIQPQVYKPDPNPGYTGAFERNTALTSMRLIEQVGTHPESNAIGPDGLIYTGLADGRIVRFAFDKAPQAAPETFVDTGGRPLAMMFDAHKQLIVADAFKGLLSISPQADITVLSNSVDGKPLQFVDDLDIAADGTIWFSDASDHIQQDEWELEFFEMRPSGKLLSYHPDTKKTQVHLDDIMFANGVALGPDDRYVLVNATIAAKIIRYWIKGPQAGSSDVFIDSLPAYIDNLSYNERGLFWVAAPSPRSTLLETLAPVPWVRGIIARLPKFLQDMNKPIPHAWVLGIDTQGKVVHNLQDHSGKYLSITDVREYQNKLLFGSIEMDSIAVFDLPPSDAQP